jgi:hypothetical protein
MTRKNQEGRPEVGGPDEKESELRREEQSKEDLKKGKEEGRKV